MYCKKNSVQFPFATKVTVKLINDELKGVIHFKGSETRRILKPLGFRELKTRNNLRLLIENLDIRGKRLTYLYTGK